MFKIVFVKYLKKVSEIFALFLTLWYNLFITSRTIELWEVI